MKVNSIVRLSYIIYSKPNSDSAFNLIISPADIMTLLKGRAAFALRAELEQ